MEEPLDKPNRRALPGVRLPVFVSGPTKLSPEQDDVRNAIFDILEEEELAPRALGQTDYPDSLPLVQVCMFASHCAGGLILGFEQIRATAGIQKYRARDSEYRDASKPIDGMLRLPTAWNHMEAGVLFALGRPLLIMCETGIADGVFFPGTASTFTHTLPANLNEMTRQRDQIRQIIKSWRGRVSATYRSNWQFADR